MVDFERKLKKISVNERRILQVFSICWSPVTDNEIQNLLSVIGYRADDGNMFSIQSVANIRNVLISKGLVCNFNESWGSGYQLCDNKSKEFFIREIARDELFDDAVEAIKQGLVQDQSKNAVVALEEKRLHLLRDYRLSIYQNRAEVRDQLFEQIIENKIAERSRLILLSVFSNPFQKDFLREFEIDFQERVTEMLLRDALLRFEPTDEIWEFVGELNLHSKPALRTIKAEELILRGEIAEIVKLIETPTSYGDLLALAAAAFFDQSYEKSIRIFDESIRLWRQTNAKKKGFPTDWHFFLYGLALFKTNEDIFHMFADEYNAYCSKNYPHVYFHHGISAVSCFLKNMDSLANSAYSQIAGNEFYTQLIKFITASIIPFLKLPATAEAFAQNCGTAGFDWAQYEVVNLLKKKEKPNVGEIFEELRGKLAFEPVGNIIPQLEAWERALKTLQTIAQKNGANTGSEDQPDQTRVAWQIDFDRKNIQPVEQKFSKKGWTDGRNIALKRLNDLDVRNLSDQDNLVIKAALKRFPGYYYGGSDYEFSWESGIELLVGHPFLFHAKTPSVNLQLSQAEPSIIIREIGDELELSLDAKITDEGIIVQKETETRYKVVKVSKDHVNISNVLRNGTLRVPSNGRGDLLKAVESLSTKIAVQSDLEEHFENVPVVTSENRIHALITPAGEGFHLEFFVKPFGRVPPYFKPGKGSESVFTDIDGVRTRTKRNLQNERDLLKEIEELCPFLAGFESPNYDWTLSNTEECLTAMCELELPRKSQKLVIEWTKGQKLKLIGNIGFDNFSMSVKGSGNWFTVDGFVPVNDELLLSMKELTKLLPSENKNFIELSDGQFIAITEKLRKHLQSLKAVMDEDNRLHNLRSGILEEFSNELESFKVDNTWTEHLERFKTAQKLVPEVPKTFDAELRPYQVDGFKWLSRLANWGVGGCLADDMGLGKTLQALAILVERAEKGKALVVAPVSVCRNWIKEAQRFSPTLNFHLFGEGDRRSQFEALGNYDVLVTSYSLLQMEEELFTGEKFATIVLDEAQAIKNRTTKRSKTVMNLKADFRLITTGTPIENHLGELWNLFNFINPGLLGTHEFFQERFGGPIEKNNDEISRKTLQRLIKPFVLRRRKNQVLDDLPEKTEIVLTVELSAEERAFYEAVRQEALLRIESEGGRTKDKRFRILAELTRLRLACCHPKLVNPNFASGSSKLELFGDTLDELLENRHKALVFSQFVKHLQIVEDYLKKKGVEYQYLDGSTPPQVRQDRIDAFQRGTGDVFLISLKAGGTGLNLTAADYVIHLDPWWNPAVEDQATDRVHRIGQQRPVTVYRLVTGDSVEEKILRLHETKRDLADSLLEGTDLSGKLSADDLLKLIAEV